MNEPVGHFHIPGDATRREYAVYIMVARHRTTGQVKLYIGKTGDNRDGCNPVISRAGNHFSFNKIHSQMRNHLKDEQTYDYDFDYFYTTFGSYRPPQESRDGIDIINEMERQLTVLAKKELKGVLNAYEGRAKPSRVKQAQRSALATAERLDQLRGLVQRVQEFVGEKAEGAEIVELDPARLPTP